MSEDYSQRAARGQAYNLAVLTAIADGKHQDRKYVLKEYLRHLAMAELLQKAPHETLKQLANGEAPSND